MMTTDKFPKRKHPRLKAYDYSQNGSYHITICTKDKECLLGKLVFNQQAADVINIHLSPYGLIADKYIKRINDVYEFTHGDKYVIMPNHVHLLITIERPIESLVDKTQKYPDIKTVVRSFKRMVGREIGRTIWQESFFDTVIDTDDEYYNVYDYIEKNPFNWIADKYYRI